MTETEIRERANMGYLKPVQMKNGYTSRKSCLKTILLQFVLSVSTRCLVIALHFRPAMDGATSKKPLGLGI